MSALPQSALDQMFESARSHNAWRAEPLPEMALRELYRLASLGPTSVNSNPGRFVFVTTRRPSSGWPSAPSKTIAPKS